MPRLRLLQLLGVFVVYKANSETKTPRRTNVLGLGTRTVSLSSGLG